MTNEEIIEQTNTLNADKCGAEYCVARVRTAIDLARVDEREKMAKEMAGLSYKETALVLLNYLLRGEVTDDDLRGLRLQWIKEDYCKCETPDREAGYTYCHTCHKHVSDERFEQLTNEVEDEKIN